MAENKKIIVYDYLFNCFGGKRHNGKVVLGASVELAIHVYKNGQEIKFQEKEPDAVQGRYLCEAYEVSFDREKLFVVQKNIKIDNLFRIVYGWDRIEAEVVGYTLDYLTKPDEEIEKLLPEEFKGMPYSTPEEVSEQVFKTFLKDNLDDFDISDNIKAQVPSVRYILT